MRFTFQVEVEVQFIAGKFASREEIAEVIMAELEGADPGSIEAGDGGEYESTSFDVSEVPQPPRPRKRK